MYKEKLKTMFLEMVIKKDASLIPVYYHPDLKLHTNGDIHDYQRFLSDHLHYYATPISYQVRYDEDTWVEQGERVAVRMWITVAKPNEASKEMELLLIAQYKDDKIIRVWELTYPDWSKLPEFNDGAH
jgi:hypothetical protein